MHMDVWLRGIDVVSLNFKEYIVLNPQVLVYKLPQCLALVIMGGTL